MKRSGMLNCLFILLLIDWGVGGYWVGERELRNSERLRLWFNGGVTG